MLQEFDYVLTPDFSLYLDYPKAIQIYNHYRKHWCGAYMQKNGIKVIPTIAWSDKESFNWCFDGDPEGGTVAVSSVGCMKDRNSKNLFVDGYKEMVRRLQPETIIFYGEILDECMGNIVHVKAYWEYVRNKDIYEQVNAEYIPYEDNKGLQQLADGFIQQSNDDLRNVTKSMGFYVDYGGGRLVMTPLSDIYQGYLDNAITGVVYGAFDYNTMIRKVVTQLTNSGLRSIDYASGWHNRVDVAARRAVMTGVSQLTGKITEMNAEKLGTENFEIAWHAGARPSHAVWQGKVWSKKELVTVCGLGTATGLLGANCYHEYYPFVKGVSERNWSDSWLAEQNRKESIPKTFNGKEYTLYEAKQQQRKMETAMRAQREKAVLLKQGGADPDDVMLAKAKYQGQLGEYTRFCKRMGLHQERERIYYDMRGRVAPVPKRFRR